ncbi:MAG TPA: LiaF domain-containing protein [Bryobacteraceae bacterium]|nr:LiaF domain-containing protein [Bryobacteraceae bacterium]
MPETPQDPKEWIRQSIIDETHRNIQRSMERPNCADSRTWRLALACGAIGFGVLLFLANLGLLPAFNFWSLWPLFPLAVGVGRLTTDRSAARARGVFLIFIGAFFLALNFGWIHFHTNNENWIFALILIGVGFLALMNVLDSARGIHPRRALGTNIWRRGEMDHDSIVADVAVLGSVKRKMDSSNFRGGDLTSILGSIEIDLRPATIAPNPEATAVLNATAIFGGIKVRVPQHWRVKMRGVSVLGNFEDKTLPPNTGLSAPALVITGWSVFGSVEIED